MSLIKSKALEHARHNEKVCLYLNEANEFNDWVITSAFYSAIHYIEHLLFPSKYEDPKTKKIKSYKCLEEFFQDQPISLQKNKHHFRSLLVDEHIPEISVDYKTLKDLCWTARYNNYQQPKEISNLCLNCLKSIKEQCENND